MPEHSVDPEVLRRKLEFIDRALVQLEQIRDGGRDAFSRSAILEAAAVRYLQVAIEAALDAANHIVARERLGLPRTYQEAVDLLIRNGVLPRDRAEDFADMVKFRNRAVHLYDDISGDEVWKILEGHLGDLEAFVRAILERFFQPGEQD